MSDEARKQAREAIAKVAFDVVEGAPMMFIADPWHMIRDEDRIYCGACGATK